MGHARYNRVPMHPLRTTRVPLSRRPPAPRFRPAAEGWVRGLALAMLVCVTWTGAARPAYAAPSGPTPTHGQTREFVDSAGRHVMLPHTVHRVFAAGPPAAILLYTLAPEKLLGWTRPLATAAHEYILPADRDLPVLGRLAGRGNTANLEAVLRARPDVIVDYGAMAPTYVSLANRAQAQTGIPYVLIDGSFDNIPTAYRLLGKMLGESARAQRLAHHAENTRREVARLRAQLPPGARPRVYYGRGPDGLVTGLRGSINVEALSVVGAVNVAAAAGKGGLREVSMEQVLAWDPGVILTLNPHFFHRVHRDPLWRGVRAVRDHRVYLAPDLPFGWFDRPPSVNRLMGVKWLLAVLYPRHAPQKLQQATREFYSLFYHVKLNDRQLHQLLENAGGTDQR
jgi:iron complex transport system substrate-binding protein